MDGQDQTQGPASGSAQGKNLWLTKLGLPISLAVVAGIVAFLGTLERIRSHVALSFALVMLLFLSAWIYYHAALFWENRAWVRGLKWALIVSWAVFISVSIAILPSKAAASIITGVALAFVLTLLVLLRRTRYTKMPFIPV